MKIEYFAKTINAGSVPYGDVFMMENDLWMATPGTCETGCLLAVRLSNGHTKPVRLHTPVSTVSGKFVVEYLHTKEESR